MMSFICTLAECLYHPLMTLIFVRLSSDVCSVVSSCLSSPSGGRRGVRLQRPEAGLVQAAGVKPLYLIRVTGVTVSLSEGGSDWSLSSPQAYTSVSKASLGIADHKELGKMMNTIIFHTKMVDSLVEMLVETSDLSIFW